MTLDFAKSGGLVPTIIQDHRDGRVLMLGYMNEAAFAKTLETGKVTFLSRSRNKLWTKGESSGHTLVAKRIEVDCDLDALLIHVDPAGPGVCHNGYRSCFFRKLDNGKWEVDEPRTYDPDGVYGSTA